MKHLIDRRRDQEANHLRTIEVQILDALLRIEELLQKREEEPVVEGNFEDAIANVTPKATPFSKAIAKKPTGGRRVDRL